MASKNKFGYLENLVDVEETDEKSKNIVYYGKNVSHHFENELQCVYIVRL